LTAETTYDIGTAADNNYERTAQEILADLRQGATLSYFPGEIWANLSRPGQPVIRVKGWRAEVVIASPGVVEIGANTYAFVRSAELEAA
jgi:hypothetical protein